MGLEGPDHASPLLTGLGLGFLVAAQVGPIWLMCARAALRDGVATGIAIGAAAAIVDLAYAALGVAGAGQLLEAFPLRAPLGLAGAAFLIWLGARALRSALRPRAGIPEGTELGTPARAFRIALIATAANPMTIASWAAIFAAASAASVVGSTPGAIVFLVGIGAGSLAWFTILATALGSARRRVGPRVLRAVDAVSGIGLVLFGAALALRSAA